MGYAKSIVLTGLALGLVVVAPAWGLPGLAQTITSPFEHRKLEADRLLNEAIEQFDAKKFDAALQRGQQALVIYRENKDRKGEGEALRQMGRAYYLLNDNAKAIAHFEQSLAIAREVKNRYGEGRSLGNLGNVYNALKEFDKAVNYYQQSVAIAQEVKDQWGEMISRDNLAQTYQSVNNIGKSIDAYEQNLIVTRALKDRDREALTLRNLGLAYGKLERSTQNSEKAIDYMTRALKLAETLNDKPGTGYALRSLGILHMDYNRFPLALENLKKSLLVWRELKNETMEANVLVLLGGLHTNSVGQDGASWCTTAISYYETSLPILRKLKNSSLEAETLTGVGFCYEETKQYPKAIAAQQRSLILSREGKNALQEGLASLNLGKIYQAMGQLPQAQQSAEQGLALVRLTVSDSRNRRWEAIGLDRLTEIYVATGAHQKAIEAQTQKIIIVQKYNIRLVDRGFNAVAVSLEQAKKFNLNQRNQRDSQWYRQRLEERGFSTSAINLSEANVSNFVSPIRDAFISLGDAYVKTADYPRALTFYQSALAPDFDKGYSYGFVDIELLGKLGRTLAQMNRLPESEAMLRLALKYNEEFRTGLGYSSVSSNNRQWNDTDRIRFAERQVEDSRQLQQVLVRQNQPEKALEVAEEGRARTFIELLSARISDRPLGKDLPPSPKLEAIRRIAKAQNATLVEYSIINSEQLYIWVIKPSGEVRFKLSKLSKTAPIPQLVADSRSSIAVVYNKKTNPEPESELNLTLQQLHKALIEPIESDLPKDPNQRVVFLPQGELFLVPFAALRDANGKYLIEKHTISTAPSIQTLQFTREQAKLTSKNGNVVVIGNPTMPIFEGTQLPDLPGARQEAIDIANLFNIQPLIGNQATKSTVLNQMKTASMVHLATHGLLNTVKSDIPGAIALAPSGSDNGLLTASEIFDLKLTANLVVLSACDTGRGDIKGDGVIGLSRSLIAAGVPSVVVSLWAVNDTSTSVLMRDFYQNLKTNPNKAQAMRQAMLNTMKNYPNPRDWAAFTLVGESDAN